MICSSVLLPGNDISDQEPIVHQKVRGPTGDMAYGVL